MAPKQPNSLETHIARIKIRTSFIKYIYIIDSNYGAGDFASAHDSKLK